MEVCPILKEVLCEHNLLGEGLSLKEQPVGLATLKLEALDIVTLLLRKCIIVTIH